MVNWELARRVFQTVNNLGEELIVKSIQLKQATLDEHLKKKTTTSEQQQANSSTEYLVHNSLERLFAWIQVIVLWHDPCNSLIAISGLFSSFLLFIYFAPRFYATVMIALFVNYLTKLWFRHIWPEIRVPPEVEREEEARLDVDRWTYLHPQLMTLAEFGQITNNLSKFANQYLKQLLVLRHEKPIKFCLIICSILSCTAYIGNRISDITLLFSITIALALAPGIYLYLLPKSAQDFLKQYKRNLVDFGGEKVVAANKLLNTSSSDEEEANDGTNLKLSEELKDVVEEKLIEVSGRSEDEDGFVIL